ncbi:B12-binding domain-containing radical SAM protein [Spirochaetia bacterium 38H-sp]|uniref:B12-binding domain-containing radical SAM protein n=1 Tax=Rarispira pelagica TaxID=3141764 RepID=A0ABU9U9G6_9SPIR
MRDANALFVFPPVYDFALYDLFLKPYGLLRIAEWFRSAGYDVRFLNYLDYADEVVTALMGQIKRRANGTGKFFKTQCDFPIAGYGIGRKFYRYGIPAERAEELLRDWYADSAPDVVVFQSGMTYWYPGLVEAHALVRRLFPNALTVTGGIYASLLPEHCRDFVGTDVVAVGRDVKEIVKAIADRGLPIPSGSVPYEPAMDFSVWKDAGVLRINTGCPFSCSYCASSAISSYSSGSGEMAFSLFSRYRELHGTRNFAFYDDALLVNKEKGILVFLDKVLSAYGSSAGEEISFFLPNAIHGRLLDYELASLLKRAGFKEIRIGFESADDDFHKEHDGKLYMEEFERAVDILIDAGFLPSQIRVYLLAGLPGQRKESVEKSLSFLENFPLNISVAEYSPVPRTFLWEESKRLSLFPLEEPLFHNNSLFPMQWEGFSLDDLAIIKKKVRLRNANLFSNH